MSLQIVGLKGGLHTSLALSNISDHIHGKRLAQAREVEVLFEMQTRTWRRLVLRNPCAAPCCTTFVLSCLASALLVLQPCLALRCLVLSCISLVHEHGPASVILSALKLLLSSCWQHTDLLCFILPDCYLAGLSLSSVKQLLPRLCAHGQTLHQIAAQFEVGQQELRVYACFCALQADWDCSSTDASFCCWAVQQAAWWLPELTKFCLSVV